MTPQASAHRHIEVPTTQKIRIQNNESIRKQSQAPPLSYSLPLSTIRLLPPGWTHENPSPLHLARSHHFNDGSILHRLLPTLDTAPSHSPGRKSRNTPHPRRTYEPREFLPGSQPVESPGAEPRHRVHIAHQRPKGPDFGLEDFQDPRHFQL